jgi:Rrf2 family protein
LLQESKVRISKRTEYGLRAMMQLARIRPDQYMHTRELCSGQETLPVKFVEAVLLALRRGEFLESKVGSGGGYRLSRPPREIFVGAIVRRLEGRLSAQGVIAGDDHSPGQLAVHLVNQELTGALENALATVSLEQLTELVAKPGKNQEMYCA